MDSKLKYKYLKRGCKVNYCSTVKIWIAYNYMKPGNLVFRLIKYRG
jgi:hypothetical protein